MKRPRFDINVRISLFYFFKNRRLGYSQKTRFSYVIAALAVSMFGALNRVSAQQRLVTDAQKKRLSDLSIQLSNHRNIAYQRALALAKIHGWALTKRTKDGAVMSLQGVDSLGYPIYVVTYENIIAAATTNTTAVQPGGSLGLNLSGSAPALANKLAIWDDGSVYTAHQEFAGKTITLHSPNYPPSDHATHVAGTMIAKGVYAPAKGMAFGASTLQSYDYNNDLPSISAAASGLLVSNHSYGIQAGWILDAATNHWEWYGLPGDSVDYKFGFYSQKTQSYDAIAYSAPYYLIVEAAGNIHSANGPPIGADYYGFNSRTDQTLVDKGPRPSNISSDKGYDVISETGNAKNILTVGAVNPLPNGPSRSSDIVVGTFSSWGPTDDGRVKPDIMGDGVSVLSTGSSGPASYITLSGTSMAAPNVTGSLYLLQEYYAQLNSGKFMRAATLKGLACHTAFDAGTPGPDYIYGWGLLNTKFAAQTLAENGHKSLVKENTLNQGATQTFKVIASGSGPLSATIAWTDPAGTATPDGTINDRTPKLVNDLDIRISDGTNTFFPWVLNPAMPSAAATKGDNIVDNVEQVFIPAPQVGLTYTITVTHKGTLQSGTQDYSLIVTGIGDGTYCASAPLSDADSRVDNVTLANINNSPPPGCTTYSNYTNLTAYLWQGKTYPLSLTLGTCGGNFDKAARVYIDWNADGTFEANELVATTGIFNATGVYQTNITVPASVVPGTTALMRVVLTETSDPSTVQPCGNYAKGETQDYTVQFSIDSSLYPHAVTGGISGSISACAGTASVNPALQQFTVSGSFLKDNLVVTAPAGFEISLSAGSGFSNSVSIVPAAGAVNTATIYVRSSATAPAGNISGSVVLTSTNMPPQAIAVSGLINQLPVINAVPDQGPYANGTATKAINFTGTGLKYNWTNDTPGIGLAASGTGNIPSFTAINKGTKPISATITVTPVPAPGLAYVPATASDNVSVINTLTDQVVAQIPVGQGPQGVSVSPNGSRVYVTNWNAGNVSVIDAGTNRVIDSIPVGQYPFGVAVSPDNSKAYVCNGDYVSVLSIRLPISLSPIFTPVFQGPTPLPSARTAAGFM
jgi:YVTN family beta-propeller protein